MAYEMRISDWSSDVFSSDLYLAGNSADNTLSGMDGNDTLVGDAGSDSLIGGAGYDDYVVAVGSGTDVIDNTGGGFDGIFFEGTVTREQLSFSRDGDDLLISIDNNTTDRKSTRLNSSH